MKREPSAAQKKENMIFHRILILFLVCFLVEIFFLIMNRLYLYAGTFMTAHAIANVCQYIAIGLFVLGIVLAVALRKKEKLRYGVFTAIGGICLFAACQLMELFYPHGAQYFCVAVPVFLVLGLVYYIYQREFLVSAVIGISTIFYLWLYRQCIDSASWAFVPYALAAVAGVLLIGCAICAWQLSKHRGKVQLFGKPYLLLSPRAKYQPIYISCAIGILTIAAALLLGATVAYFAMFLVGGYLLILAVYYTTKLM